MGYIRDTQLWKKYFNIDKTSAGNEGEVDLFQLGNIYIDRAEASCACFFFKKGARKHF